MTENDDLTRRVSAALVSSGQALELRTARSLMQAGFSPVESFTYEDPSSGRSVVREGDVFVALIKVT